MSKRTTLLEKQAFISLTIKKLRENGDKKSAKKVSSNSKGLDVQYKTAQRYARELLHVNLSVPAYKGTTEQFYNELAALTGADQVNELESFTEEFASAPTIEVDDELETSEPVKKVESPAKLVDDAQPVPAHWDKPDAEPYLKLASWLVAIDKGQINGTVTEAKEFISTIDGYADKLQALVVKQAKEQLKNLLRQVKECEAVLDKAEVENIWLEVGTERGELIVTPFSAETTTRVVELPITEAPEVEQSNTVVL